jgi:mono/diheme cytochrome c family protein
MGQWIKLHIPGWWLALGFLLAACAGDADPAVTAPAPTLDLNQIPVLGETEIVPPVPVEAADPRFPIPPAEGDALEAGRSLYERYCGLCHGMDGEGARPDPYAVGAAPPHNDEGHTWHHADQQNFATVWYGGYGAMPAFHDRLSEDEIFAILAYIKTWWAEDQLQHQTDLTQSVVDGVGR